MKITREDALGVSGRVRKSATFIAIGLLAGISAMATTKRPDFTGTWRVNFQKSVLQIPAPESTTFVVEHKEPKFKLTRTHVSKGQSDTFSIELTTDGKEVTVEHGGRTIRCRLTWDANVLVFDSRIVLDGKEASNIVRYEMAADGRSFTARERFRSEKLNYDNVWVLEKLP